MRTRPFLLCLGTFLLGVALAATVPSSAAITEIRYSYPGECRSTPNRVTPAGDVVVLISGEPLEAALVLAASSVKSTGSLLDPKTLPLTLETTTGFTGIVLDDSAKGVRIRLQAGPDTPSRVSAGTVRLLRGKTEIGSFKVAALVRPRIDRISLDIPSSGNVTTVRIAAETDIDLKLEGQGLEHVLAGPLPSEFVRFEKTAPDRVRVRGASRSQLGSTRVEPWNFRWDLTSCQVAGPPSAALTVEIRNAPPVPVLENLLQSRQVTCSGELRRVINDVFCARIKPPRSPDDSNQEQVPAPPIRWGVQGLPDVVTGSFVVILKRDNVERERKTVKRLLPGEKVMFDFSRFGLTRTVRTYPDCPGCFDLQDPASNWTDPVYSVHVAAPPIQ